MGFFRFFLTLDHIVQDGQYRLSKGFPGSKGSISGQISYFRPLYRISSNFENIAFFAIFRDFFGFSQCDSRPESAGINQIGR